MVSETEDILRRTLEGLEGDFEELRQELLTDLENHDDELRFYVDSLPEWLALPMAPIKALLKFPPESKLRGAALGPHAVAMVAGEIELFVKEWLGAHGEIEKHPFEIDPALPAKFHEAYKATRDNLEMVEAEASATALAAHASLNHIRDDILAELEEEREQDTEALQELISMGDLDRTQDRRQEIARLWEDQRERASEFLERWSKLDAFVDVGLERTVSGLEELVFLLENMHQGMLGGYPTLAQTARKPARERKPSMSLVLDEDEIDELRGSKDRSGISQEFSVLPTEPPSVSAAPENDGDFDPYGDLPEEEKEDVDPEKIKAEQRAKFLAETKKKKREKEAFLADPEQLDDDLVYASDEEQGPMVDFFDDDEDDTSSGDFFRTPAPSSTLEESSPALALASSSAPATRDAADTPTKSSGSAPARSPYDVFLSEDSSPGLEAHEPLVASSGEFDGAADGIDDFDFDPGEEPLIEDLEDNPTIPFGGLEATEGSEGSEDTEDTEDGAGTDTAEIGTSEADDAETKEEDSSRDVEALDTPTTEIEDAGPTAPSIEVPGSDTRPIEDEDLLDEVSTPTSEVEEELEGMMVESVAPPAPATAPEPPSLEEVSEDEPLTDDLEEDEEEELFSEPEDAPRPKLAARGSAIRLRQAHRPIGASELALAYGLPMVILLVILGLAASAATPEDNPLKPGSVTQITALVLFAWLALGPWVMRWKISFQGWRPIVMRRAQLRDEAEVILEDDLLEVGPWVLRRDELRESSIARWESPMDRTRGWLLTLVDDRGEVWAMVSPQRQGEEDHGAGWEASSLPITHAPDDAWQVDPKLFHVLEEALTTGH